MLSPQVTSIIVAIASSLGTSSPAREPVSLAYKWTVNQTVSYRITQDGNQKVSGMPMPDATQTVHQVSTLQLTPKSVADDGATTIEAVYSAISLDLQPMMDKNKYSFDSAASAEDPQNPLSGPVKAVVGQKFTVVLGPDCAVRKIDGFQAIADKSAQATTPAASRMAPLLKGTFSEQAVNKFFEVAFHRLPASPVEPGGSWTTTYDSAIPQMGTMTATGQSTLTSLDAGAATIDTTVAMALKPPADGEAVNPMMCIAT